MTPPPNDHAPDVDAIRARYGKYTSLRDMQKHALEDVQALLKRVEDLERALSEIEKSARLHSDPRRAHSCHTSFNELLSGFRRLAAMARLARMKGTDNG